MHKFDRKTEIFVQACRGDKYNSGAKLAGSDVVDTKGKSEFLTALPLFADQLIMYATPEGFVAVRNTADGNWFNQELCEQLKKDFTDDLLSVLTVVNRKMAMKEML